MMSPEDRLERTLRTFSRLLGATLDADPAVRGSIESLARRIDQGGLDRVCLRATIEQLDDLLVGEVGRRHR